MSEKFDFSKIEDQEKFEKTSEERQGEIINESHQEALEIKGLAKRTEFEEKEIVPYFVDNLPLAAKKLDEGVVLSLEEAFLLVRSEKMQELSKAAGFDGINYSKSEEEIEAAKLRADRASGFESWARRFKNAAELVRYFNNIDEEPKDTQVFLDNIEKMIATETHSLFSSLLIGKIGDWINVILENSTSDLIKFKAIQMLVDKKFKQKNESRFVQIRNILIQNGDIELLLEIIGKAGANLDEEELNKCGERALELEHPSCAIQAFQMAKNEIGLEKAKELENIKIAEAQKRMEKMPEGFETNGLMIHETRYEFVEDILKSGILSALEQYKKRGTVNRVFDPVHQASYGAWDYISVTDPWYGNATEPGHRNKRDELVDLIMNEIKPVMTKKRDWPRGKEGEEIAKIFFAAYIYWTEPPGPYIPLEAVADPRWQKMLERVNKIFDDYSKVEINRNKDKPKLYYWEDKPPQEVNLPQMFVPAQGIGFLLNPELQRYCVFGSSFRGESFVKNKITLKDILGIVVPSEIFPLYEDYQKLRNKTHDIIVSDLKKIAQQTGIPLYEAVTEKGESDDSRTSYLVRGKYKEMKLIWPEKMDYEEVKKFIKEKDINKNLDSGSSPE